MTAKEVYVISSPRTIIAIYERKKDALDHFGDLLGHVPDLRLTCEIVMPDLPF